MSSMDIFDLKERGDENPSFCADCKRLLSNPDALVCFDVSAWPSIQCCEETAKQGCPLCQLRYDSSSVEKRKLALTCVRGLCMADCAKGTLWFDYWEAGIDMRPSWTEFYCLQLIKGMISPHRNDSHWI